jgi:RNA polymerase sigma factor (sigma-70 family)
MDEQAFALLIEPHRRALHLHCYRTLGSLHDADDALQETMLRAWKGSDRYEPRAQLTTWLHTIATNVCLTAIARRRARPAELSEDLEHLQPYPDRLLEDLVVRETLELAFITATQLLPPKQRAVLIMRDVLGWSAKETRRVRKFGHCPFAGKSCFAADRATKPRSAAVTSQGPLDQVPSTIPAGSNAMKATKGPRAQRAPSSRPASPAALGLRPLAGRPLFSLQNAVAEFTHPTGRGRAPTRTEEVHPPCLLSRCKEFERDANYGPGERSI